MGSLTWNPSSPFKRPFRFLLFWHPYELFIRLYEHMTEPVPALTASMNGLGKLASLMLHDRGLNSIDSLP